MAELRSLGFAGQKTWDKKQRMGFAGATPNYETTSQQDNEWRLRKTSPTTDNRQRTTELRLRYASPDKGLGTND